jgi:phospholipid-transporting ATPase
MEIVKFQQAQLINSDLDMYYAKTDTPALCRTSSLVEELGQIEYVFSDKTGTLTCNEMEFRCCSVAGVAYAEVVDDSKRDDAEDGKDSWRTFSEMKSLLAGGSNPFLDPTTSNRSQERAVIKEFLTLLAVCHTVIPEFKDEKMHYQASSPDEAALVAGAELLGYQFRVRTEPGYIVHVFAYLTVLGFFIGAKTKVCFC